MSQKYYNYNSEHRRIRENRAISGHHAMIQLPEKYLHINDRRYALKLGNLKISGNTIIFNLPPITTCPGRGICESYCYAMSPHFQNIAESRQINYEHSLGSYFTIDMIRIIKRLLSKYTYIRAMRLHEAGDFYSQTYFRKWITIAKAIPEITFYAYTKSAFTQFGFEIPDNMVLWYSHGGKFDAKYKTENNQALVIHPGQKFPKGVYRCPAIGHPEKVCGRDCTYCSRRKNGRRVAFPLH